MALTPVEIRHVELRRAWLRGYRRSGVDRLLTEIKEFGASENANPDVQGNRMTMVIAPVK